LQLSPDVENQVNNCASDNYGFEKTQTTMRDHETKEDECQRGYVDPDSQHLIATQKWMF
jgi:hypothetical protein